MANEIWLRQDHRDVKCTRLETACLKIHAWLPLVRCASRVKQFKVKVVICVNPSDMDATDANDDAFGIDVIFPDGDKTAPCCPHGKSTSTAKLR